MVRSAPGQLKGGGTGGPGGGGGGGGLTQAPPLNIFPGSQQAPSLVAGSD